MYLCFDKKQRVVPVGKSKDQLKRVLNTYRETGIPQHIRVNVGIARHRSPMCVWVTDADVFRHRPTTASIFCIQGGVEPALVPRVRGQNSEEGKQERRKGEKPETFTTVLFLSIRRDSRHVMC